MPRINVDQIKQFVDACGTGTKVYLGADSIRYREKGIWYAEYTVAVVIHINGTTAVKFLVK